MTDELGQGTPRGGGVRYICGVSSIGMDRWACMLLEVTRPLTVYSTGCTQRGSITERHTEMEWESRKECSMLTFGLLEDTINGARAAAAGHGDVEVVVMNHDEK